jgi:hypothetical protein
MTRNKEYKVTQEVLAHFGTEIEKEIRIHLLIDKYIRKSIAHKANINVEFDGVYFEKDELKYILGANNYKEYIKEVIEKELLNLLDRKNKYGKQLYYFAPREFTDA